jgi:PIN domain nuclease of toxin-antitoxin system
MKFEDVTVSLVSILELQAKAARLNVPAKSTIKAIDAILSAFRVESFHKPAIIEASYELRRLIPDYLDCVIVATAITSKEDLATEDSLILAKKETLRRKYNVEVLSFKDIIGSPSRQQT